MNLLVRCSRALGNETPEEVRSTPNDWYLHSKYYDNNTLQQEPKNTQIGDSNGNGNLNMLTLGGNRPIFFQNSNYMKKRNALIQNLVPDVAKYGSNCKQPKA